MGTDPSFLWERWDDESICETISPDMLSRVQPMTPKRFGNLVEVYKNVDVAYGKPVVGSHRSLDPECSQA